MKTLKLFEEFNFEDQLEKDLKNDKSMSNIDIESDHINHDRKYSNIDDAYTKYAIKLKRFNFNNAVKIKEAKGDVWGDDFKGFGAEIEVLLTNGILVKYQHEKNGEGSVSAITSKGTEFFKDTFSLEDLGIGESDVLIMYLNKILKYEF